MKLWQSPNSGRLHTQRMCSGGAGYRNVPVERSGDYLDELWKSAVDQGRDPSEVICRCAWSKVSPGTRFRWP